MYIEILRIILSHRIGYFDRVVESGEHLHSDSTVKHATTPTPTTQPWSTHDNSVLMLA